VHSVSVDLFELQQQRVRRVQRGGVPEQWELSDVHAAVRHVQFEQRLHRLQQRLLPEWLHLLQMRGELQHLHQCWLLSVRGRLLPRQRRLQKVQQCLRHLLQRQRLRLLSCWVQAHQWRVHRLLL
jgi:hypothetical protein